MLILFDNVFTIVDINKLCDHNTVNGTTIWEGSIMWNSERFLMLRYTFIWYIVSMWWIMILWKYVK
jgi:hypothetical protein